MTQTELETMCFVIRCHVERAESGNIKLVLDPNGQWNIVKGPPKSGLVKFFEPQYQEGIDQFGNTTPTPTK